MEDLAVCKKPVYAEWQLVAMKLSGTLPKQPPSPSQVFAKALDIVTEAKKQASVSTYGDTASCRVVPSFVGAEYTNIHLHL